MINMVHRVFKDDTNHREEYTVIDVQSTRTCQRHIRWPLLLLKKLTSQHYFDTLAGNLKRRLLMRRSMVH